MRRCIQLLNTLFESLEKAPSQALGLRDICACTNASVHKDWARCAYFWRRFAVKSSLCRVILLDNLSPSKRLDSAGASLSTGAKTVERQPGYLFAGR